MVMTEVQGTRQTGGDTAKSLGSPIAVVCSTSSTCIHNPTPGSFPTYSPYTRQRLSGSSGLPMKARPPWSVSHTVYFRFFSMLVTVAPRLGEAKQFRGGG